MKKRNIPKFCFALSVLLLFGFVTHTVVDYMHYNTGLHAAPFYIWIVVNALCFIIPAVIAWLVGIMIGKRKREAE